MLKDLVLPYAHAWLSGVVSFCVSSLSLYRFDFNAFLQQLDGMTAASIILGVGLWSVPFALFLGLSRTKKTWPAWLLSTMLAVVFAIVNHLKMKDLKQVFVPADLYVAPNLFALKSYIHPDIIILLALMLVTAGFSFFEMFRKNQAEMHLPWFVRMLLAMQIAGGLVISFAITGLSPEFKNLVIGDHLMKADWAPTDVARRNGLLVSFLAGIGRSVLRRPPNLAFDNSTELLKDKLDSQTPEKNDPDTKIVVLMLESWMDPYWFPFQYSEDPVPNFHSFIKEAKEFRLISPSYGGITANVEFEILTGLSMSAFPVDSVPYFHFIRRRIFSLPHVLKLAEFTTTAVHNYEKSFWHRNVVYPFLGFDDFISKEEMQGPLPTYLGFPEDDALYTKILSKLEAKGLQFVLGISMVTHGSFDVDIPDYAKVIRLQDDAQSQALPPGVRRAYEVYLNKLHEADASFGRFVEQVKHVNNLHLIAYGDHQPSFADQLLNYQIMERSTMGYTPKGINIQNAKKYLVPALYYHTGSHPVPLTQEIMSVSCLSPLVLKMAQVKIPPFYTYVDSHCKEHPILHKDSSIDPYSSGDYKYQNLAFDVIFNSAQLAQYVRGKR